MKKEFEVICKNCNKKFKVIEEETKFPIKGDKYFCCRSCANTRHHSKETKEKIKKSIANSEYHLKFKSKKLDIYDKHKRFFTGSKELDDKYKEISCHQSPKWFKNLIPFGFNINILYTEKVIQEFYKVKELLYNEYVINCLSPADIYKKYNCKEYFKHSETLLNIFKKWNFPIRSYSASTLNSFLQGKLKSFENNSHPIGHEQWYKTWNNKDVYLRSNLELDYAKQLDEQKIDYDVEGLRIKYWDSQRNDYRCAIPDFYIPSENMIVEIKSVWTLNEINMKDKMKAYLELGYKFKLICDHKEIHLQ